MNRVYIFSRRFLTQQVESLITLIAAVGMVSTACFWVCLDSSIGAHLLPESTWCFPDKFWTITISNAFPMHSDHIL